MEAVAKMIRRVVAVFLLAVSGLLPVLSALTSGAAPKIPACCRRDGDHRCSMTDVDNQQDRRAGSKCAQFPVGKALPASMATALPACEINGLVPLEGRFDSIVGCELRRAEAHGRANQQRGPPLS